MPEASATGPSGGGICGCRGSRHPALTNCRSCALIYCVEEKDYLLLGAGGVCMFCSTECTMSPAEFKSEGLLQSMPESTQVAYKLKDKLLQFDLENAKRSHVRDSQADYYETHDVWISEEEKSRIDAKQQQRREQLKPSNRRNLLSISVHKTGSKFSTSFGSSVPDEDDEGTSCHYDRTEDGRDSCVEGLQVTNEGLLGNKSAVGAVYRHFLEARSASS